MQVTEKVFSRQSSVISQEDALAAKFDLALRPLLFPSLMTDDWRLKTPLAVALSGGADSMALTLLADAWARTNGMPIVALTVDHGLRAESRAEAEQVAAWMRARGIAHHILTPPPSDASNNLQENARQRRYDALADFCSANAILHCLIAHHADDQCETVALQVARGETADGPAGIAATRNYRGVRFLRPLLNIARDELRDFLRHHPADWVEDPSNENTGFARVRVRQQFADDPQSKAALQAMAALEATARTLRDQALADAAMRTVTLHPLGFAQIDLAAWRQLDETLASQLLADCLTTIGGHVYRPRRYETQWLAAALHRPFPKRTLHRCEISVSGNSIHIARESARVEAPVTLSGEGELLWDQRFRLRYQLPPTLTLTLRALRHDGKKQLAARLPATIVLPLGTPSVWHLDELVHIPHIENSPFTLPHGARVTMGFTPPKPLAAAPFW